MSRQQFPKIVSILIVAMLLLFFVACTFDGNLLVTNEAVPTLTKEHSTVKATTPTLTQTATRTPTETRSIPTKTLTVIPTFTWTPISTLSRPDALKLVDDLLQNNNGCRLPCWWGLTPGETSWVSAEQFLRSFVTKISDHGPVRKWDGTSFHTYSTYQIYYDLQDLPTGGGASIDVKDGVIDLIFIGPGSTKNFNIYDLLKEYGRPSQVYLWTAHDAPYRPLPFDLVIYYDEQRILAWYETDAIETDTILRGCFQGISPKLFTWSDGKEITEQTINDWVRGPGANFLVKPLEDTTDLTVEDFYQLFQTPDNNQCIETQRDNW